MIPSKRASTPPDVLLAQRRLCVCVCVCVASALRLELVSLTVFS